MALYWLTQFLCSRRLSSPWKSGKTYCIPSIFIILRERDGFFKIFQFLYIPNLQFFFSIYEIRHILLRASNLFLMQACWIHSRCSHDFLLFIRKPCLRNLSRVEKISWDSRRVRVSMRSREDASAFFEISDHPPFFIPLRFRGIVAHPWNPTFPGRAHVATA